MLLFGFAVDHALHVGFPENIPVMASSIREREHDWKENRGLED
jgi:hypothetical protein